MRGVVSLKGGTYVRQLFEGGALYVLLKEDKMSL